MYAVIADSGTQFFVEPGQKLLIDHRNVEPGDSIEFGRVLLVGGGENGTLIGRPTIEGAKVIASVLRGLRTRKIHVQTYKRRKNSNRKTRGHRQSFTAVKIDKIKA